MTEPTDDEIKDLYALKSAVSGVLLWRVDGRTLGDIRDNDASRAAISKLVEVMEKS